MGPSPERARDTLELLDWRRRVFSLYDDVRAAADPEAAWLHWRRTRDRLFAEHPQSPLPPGRRDGFRAAYFRYDPRVRVAAEVLDAPAESTAIGSSGEEPIAFTRFARAAFVLDGEAATLDVYRLETYGGGVFVPFRDATAGSETYGGGRYLLDTVKGADLGLEDGRLVLDFNFAYNPSCAYDPRWVCPLTPPANRLRAPVRAGERTAPAQ